MSAALSILNDNKANILSKWIIKKICNNYFYLFLYLNEWTQREKKKAKKIWLSLFHNLIEILQIRLLYAKLLSLLKKIEKNRKK